MEDAERAPPRRPRKGLRRFSRLAWVLAAAAAVSLPAAFALDRAATDALRRAAPSVRDALAWIGEYGDWVYQMGAGVLLLAFARATRRLRMQRVLLCMILASCAGGIASNAIKPLAGRTRPFVDAVPQGFYGPRLHGEWIVAEYRFCSFPSSHSATWAGFLGVLLFARGGWPLLALLLLPLVPLARVSTRAHHLSDVTAGVLLGFLLAGLAWHVAYARLRAVALRLVRRGVEAAA